MHNFDDPDKHRPPSPRDRMIERLLVAFAALVLVGIVAGAAGMLLR